MSLLKEIPRCFPESLKNKYICNFEIATFPEQKSEHIPKLVLLYPTASIKVNSVRDTLQLYHSSFPYTSLHDPELFANMTFSKILGSR